MAQDIFHLPVNFFDYDDPESMALAIHRNFKEVERMLSHLQLYMKMDGRVVITRADEFIKHSIAYGMDADKPKLR